MNVHDGPSRRVSASGLVIGRKQDCDIVSSDPSASRRHAMVRLLADGAELVPLGRRPVAVNGKPYDHPIALADGDEVGVPGLRLNVQIDARRPASDRPSHWHVERARGGSFGLVHSPFLIGGSEADDLIVRRWPGQALRFHVAQGELYLEPGVAKVTRNGAAISEGAIEQLFAGDAIGFRRESFLIRHTVRDATTVVAALTQLPSRVTVEILPRGGRVVFTMPDGDRAVFLADRRLDLVIALLRPPGGLTPGDYVTDDLVRAVVWPRNPDVSRPEINVLISRCRRDLVEAGLAGTRLIERAPGGGGTRLALAPGAVVAIET